MFETVFTSDNAVVYDQNASFCCQQCDLTNDVMKDAPKNPMFEDIFGKSD